MAAELIVAPEAEQDLAEAHAWYEDQRIGLGEDFLSCVDACIEALRRNPEMYAEIYESYRRAWSVAFLTECFTSMPKIR